MSKKTAPKTNAAPKSEDAKITLDELSEDELDKVSGGVRATGTTNEAPVAAGERPVSAVGK